MKTSINNVTTINGAAYSISVNGSGATSGNVWVYVPQTAGQTFTLPELTVDPEQKKIDDFDRAMKGIG